MEPLGFTSKMPDNIPKYLLYYVAKILTSYVDESVSNTAVVLTYLEDMEHCQPIHSRIAF
jgi:hypothetical protein